MKKNAALEKTKTNVVSADEIKKNPDGAPKPNSSIASEMYSKEKI